MVADYCDEFIYFFRDTCKYLHGLLSTKILSIHASGKSPNLRINVLSCHGFCVFNKFLIYYQHTRPKTSTHIHALNKKYIIRNSLLKRTEHLKHDKTKMDNELRKIYLEYIDKPSSIDRRVIMTIFKRYDYILNDNTQGDSALRDFALKDFTLGDFALKDLQNIRNIKAL